MARPPKEGLEYFPIVTSFDEKIELIIAEFGPEGLGIIIGLFQRIYANGYYMNWNEDTLMLFATKHINTEITRVNAVLMKCLERNIFNRDLYNKYGILTSNGIQKQFLKVCKDCRRKSVQFIKEYCLVNDKKLTDIITEFIRVNAEETPENDVESTQKEREREIERERKEESNGVSSGETLSPTTETINLINYYEQLKPGESISSHINTLNEWIEDYGYEWSKEAIELCISKKKTFIKAWIEAVLKNWKAEGKEDNDGGTGTDGEHNREDPCKDRASPYDFSKYS